MAGWALVAGSAHTIPAIRSAVTAKSILAVVCIMVAEPVLTSARFWNVNSTAVVALPELGSALSQVCKEIVDLEPAVLEKTFWCPCRDALLGETFFDRNDWLVFEGKSQWSRSTPPALRCGPLRICHEDGVTLAPKLVRSIIKIIDWSRVCRGK